MQELEQEKSAHYGPDNTADLYEDEKKITLVKAEKNISFFPGYRANEVETENAPSRRLLRRISTPAPVCVSQDDGFPIAREMAASVFSPGLIMT